MWRACSKIAVSEKDAQPVMEATKKHGSVYGREPGIIVYRALTPEDQLISVTPEDQVISVFTIEIWKRFKVYATVLLRSPLRSLG